MALATYTDLQVAIAQRMGRLGDATITTYIPDYIVQFESKVRRGFRYMGMQKATTLVSVASVQTVALPSDYLENINLTLLGSPTNDLQAAGLDFIQLTFDQNTTSRPEYYAIAGNNIYLGPVPDSAYNIAQLYYAFAPLSTLNPTNWLMTNYPDIYLYGCLVEANAGVMDADTASGYKTLYTEAKADLDASDFRARLSPDAAMAPDIWAF